MITTLLDVDPLTHTKTWHHYDPSTDETTIEEVQDCQSYIDRNRLVHDNPELWDKKDDFGRRVASIPNGVITKWMREYGVNVYQREHWPAVRRLLNSPDWRYLKVRPGRI